MNNENAQPNANSSNIMFTKDLHFKETLPLFVQTIEIEVRNQVQRLHDIRSGRVVPRVLHKKRLLTLSLFVMLGSRLIKNKLILVNIW